MTKPKKPATLNGDHGMLWDQIQHLNERIDKVYIMITVGVVGEVGIMIGIVEILR